jgi:hypothetical protein
VIDLAGHAPGELEATRIIAASAKATGLSPQVLKRYVAVLRRTEVIAEREGLPLESLLSSMFNVQEVAVRLCDRSPDEGLQSLKDVVAGRGYGLSTFRRLLAQAPMAVASPERARREIQRAKANGRDRAEAAIEAARETMWGDGAVVRRRPRLRYFGGVGLEVIGGNGDVVAGVELMVPHPGENREILASRAASSLALAPFFREFFLAFASAQGDDAAGRAVSLLEWLEYGWIGVIAVDSEGRAEVRRKPVGVPTPDMSGRYEALLRKFSATNHSARTGGSGSKRKPTDDR